MLTEATKANLRRKSQWVDHVQLHDGVPLFSWVDISPTDLCNRSCSFCPRADPVFYPNQRLHMSLDLARKIGDELRELNYEGAVVLCGFGEPLLHPRICEFVSCFGDVRVEIVTSGDRLTPMHVNELVDAGCDFFVVSMYDGPHQKAEFTACFDKAGCDEEMYLLRDRWHTEEDDFGLKLTNRAGTVSIGRQDPVNVGHPCHYLTYQMTIDWNGDVLLCSQDWHKKVKYGNLATQSLLEVWTSSAMSKRRRQLMRGRDGLSPCAGCNVSGDLHGFNHVDAWRAS